MNQDDYYVPDDQSPWDSCVWQDSEEQEFDSSVVCDCNKAECLFCWYKNKGGNDNECL